MYTKLLRYLNADFTLGNCLFGSVELIKNTDPDTYKHSGYGIVFNSRLKFSFKYGAMRKTFLYLELIWAHLWILIIKIKIS